MASTTTPGPDDYVLTMTNLRELSDIANLSASIEITQELSRLLSVNLQIFANCTPGKPEGFKPAHVIPLVKTRMALRKLGMSSLVVDVPLHHGVKQMVSHLGDMERYEIKHLSTIARVRQACGPGEEYECALLDKAFRKASRQLIKTAKQKLSVSISLTLDSTWLYY